MKSFIIRSVLVFILVFVSMFLIRLGYGYYAYPQGEVIRNNLYQGNLFSDFSLSRKNYAGQKKKSGGRGLAGPAAIDQRYEKVAELGLSSSKFDEDEAQIRTIAKEANALIQHEQAFGLEGQRQLQLALGVPPESFDDVISRIRAVGRPVNFQVNKVDKTNEYRELLAQQESLKKSRDNLMALTSRDAELEDLILLETRILDLENQIQSLGVSVGEFDSEFEFVTIKLTMAETRKDELRDIPLVERSMVALRWAVKYTLALTGAFFLFAFAAAISVFTIHLGRKIFDWVK